MTATKPSPFTESLRWRKTENLAVETLFLEAIRDAMDHCRKYKPTHKDRVDAVIAESKTILAGRSDYNPNATELSPIQRQQALIYAFIGPGFMFLPGMATRQPADFYIDDRCGTPKAGRRVVLAAVEHLVRLCKEANVDPRKVPEAPNFHNCRLF